MTAGSPEKKFAVEVEQAVGAPPLRVYEAWLDSSDWDKWFTHDSKIDAQVGGKYINGDGDTGEYTALVPGELIRFTWDNPSACPGSDVEIELQRAESGVTLVKLTHRNLPTPETGRGEMIDGWGWALSNLAAYLEGRPTQDHDAWIAEKYS